MLSGETVVADVWHGALDASLVFGAPHTCRIDLEAAGLCVLQEGFDQPRLQRVVRVDDGLCVVRQQSAEDSAEEDPGGFARLDCRSRGFSETRIDETMSRTDSGKDPCSETPTSTGQIRHEPTDPTGIDLQLVAGIAVEHRDRRGASTETQLGHGETMERRVRDIDPVADQQLAHLRQPQAVCEPTLDPAPCIQTPRPRNSTLPIGPRVQCRHDDGQPLLGQCRGPVLTLQLVGLGGTGVAPDRLRIQAELSGDGLVAPP